MKLLLENWRKYLKEDTEPYPYQIYCDMDGVLVDFEATVVDQINADIVDELIQTEEMLALRQALARADRPTWEKEAAAGPMKISKYDIKKDIEPRSHLTQVARNYMYFRFKNNQDLWATMPWMEGGEELWNYIKGSDPIILTTPMGEPSRPGQELDLSPSELGKREWIKTHLDPIHPPKDIIFSDKKYEYAVTNGRPNVLIDDFSTNTIPWATPRHIEGSNEKMSGFAILHTNFKDTKAALEYIASQAAEKSTS